MVYYTIGEVVRITNDSTEQVFGIVLRSQNMGNPGIDYLVYDSHGKAVSLAAGQIAQSSIEEVLTYLRDHPGEESNVHEAFEPILNLVQQYKNNLQMMRRISRSWANRG